MAAYSRPFTSAADLDGPAARAASCALRAASLLRAFPAPTLIVVRRARNLIAWPVRWTVMAAAAPDKPAAAAAAGPIPQLAPSYLLKPVRADAPLETCCRADYRA